MQKVDWTQDLCSTINDELKQILVSDNEHQELLYKSASYSLLSPGKRIRPILTLSVAEALGTDPSVALRPACAIELIHTYSLIHDDLPCMDDDDFRREKPSLHKVYDEGHAVLTGDYLLTLAFEVLADSPNLSAEQKIALVRSLSKASGGNGMIGGQVFDIESEDETISLQKLQIIHEKKTGALFSAAAEFAAIIGGVSSTDRDLYRRFGLNLGLAFQVIDDILDSDEDEDKSSYVTFMGSDAAKEYANELTESCRRLLSEMGTLSEKLDYLLDFVVERIN